MDDIANLTCAQWYAYDQSENFSRVIREAREEVEGILGIKICLGERMILLEIARGSLKDLLSLFEGPRCHEYNTFKVSEEAAFRFLREYYPHKIGHDVISRKLKMEPLFGR